jgi:hypothetical protein
MEEFYNHSDIYSKASFMLLSGGFFTQLVMYSRVSNKRTGPNKRTGGKKCQIQ